MFTRAGLISTKTDRLLSYVFSNQRGPTAFMHFIDLRRRKPAGFAHGFLRLKQHRPTNPQAGVFLQSKIPMTAFIENVSPLLPKPCHCQNYDRPMSPLSLVLRDSLQGCVRTKQTTKRKDRFVGGQIGEPIQSSWSTIWSPCNASPFCREDRRKAPLAFGSQ